MITTDALTALLGAAVVLAILVIRTAVQELREPGSARREWACLRDRRSLVIGTATVLVLGAVGWTFTGPAAVPWAVLAGLLATRISTSGR
ncbi:hypothetical protein [Streptomyces narbonensis]|uniref:hypothetical protein n=1 Tax=Streptomyces narbonensis TaxID=67333 RepID=UPI0019BCB2F4|nr:hypothetical protein [Streptomyces narbonensis]GGW08298.1 hypothetical protein GCM10010230_54870 [Streptomyces narbonensis]